MHRHKQLYDRVASFDNVLAAARDALRGKRGRAPGATFFSNLEHEVAALHRELRDGSYQPGPYHYFQIHDPKTRTVAAADFRDRVVHHAIVRVLEPLFEGRFIEDTYACRSLPQRSRQPRRHAQGGRFCTSLGVRPEMRRVEFLPLDRSRDPDGAGRARGR